WRDHADWKSCPPEQVPASTDQLIGTGDGATAKFQLRKTYGGAHAPWPREIKKPAEGSIIVAVDGASPTAGVDFSTSITRGNIAFVPARIPPPGAQTTAGFAFDVPVRFDTDRLEVNLQGFRHGAIPNIPIVEIRL